ncbi:fibroblast growth factor receptor 1-like [Rhopilema esculentum]|uniref:fibroblast growth factor receptor 1-like n=1 Tax=Rhopilema esculentum TaxID=499914 RepID=UPI0031DEDFC3
MMASKVTVVVFAKPNITSITPAIQYKSVNDKAVIKCSVEGHPYANVTWEHDGGNDISRKVTTKNNTSILKLRWLEVSDTGYYNCIANNRAGRVQKKAFIKVHYPPKITALPPFTNINVDANGRIQCKAVGSPIPRVYWHIETGSKKIELVSGQSHGTKYSVSKTEKDLIEEAASNYLVINSVDVNDWKSNFTCMVANSQGSDVETVKIQGFEKPGVPQILKIIPLADKVIVQWSVPKDGGSKILAYVIEYKNETQKEWLSREIRPANIDRYQIMDLKPHTLYSFRLYAKNAVGRSAFSKQHTYLTTGTASKDANPGTARPSGRDSSVSKQKDGILGSFGLTAMIGVFAGVFLFLVIIFVIVFFLFRKVQKTTNSQTASIPGSRPVSMENGTLLPPDSRRPSARPPEVSEFIPLLPRTDHWEFPRDRLRLSTVLGSGAFGMVMRGDAQGIRGSSGSVKVAVKVAKDVDNENARKDLCAELDMLKLLPEHPNVVGLLGCCSRSEPLMIIVEYCAHGDLQGFLRNSRGISEQYYKTNYHPSGEKLSSKMLLKFAWQITKGMTHLSAFKVIHRDLASRNILVDENLVCKISDFGFARDIYIEDQYMKKSQGGRFPIKWMAIESLLDGISTSKSDVWSFGVVLWEIVTLGASPYPGMNSYEVVSFLQDGYRMDKPKHCSDEVYAVSMDCWHIAAQRRPTFEELADRLKELVDDNKEYIDMNFYQDHLYENFDVNLGCQTSANTSAMELNTSESTPLAAAASS